VCDCVCECVCNHMRLSVRLLSACVLLISMCAAYQRACAPPARSPRASPAPPMHEGEGRAKMEPQSPASAVAYQEAVHGYVRGNVRGYVLLYVSVLCVPMCASVWSSHMRVRVEQVHKLHICKQVYSAKVLLIAPLPPRPANDR
jgi:hypothetical protein